MMDYQTCLAKAEEVERMAAAARDAISRDTLLNIAERWRKMAADPTVKFSTDRDGWAMTPGLPTSQAASDARDDVPRDGARQDGTAKGPLGRMKLDSKALWRAIDSVAADNRLTVSGLARAAGLDATAFNKSKRAVKGRARWPSTHSIANVLEATHMSFVEFAEVVECSASER
jgi:hypothetical protein